MHENDRMSFEFSPGLFPPLLSAMREAVVVTDAEANIVFVNAVFEQQTGYSAEEVLGCNPRILKSTRHDTTFYRAMWQTLFSKGEWQGTVINRRKDGMLLQVEQRIYAISHENEITHFLSIWQNVTEAAQFQEKLFNFEKNQQVGRATGSIAHDFNNILAAIVGFCEVGLLRVGSDQVAKAYFTDIGRAADTGVRLVRKLLALCRTSKSSACVSLKMASVVEGIEPILKNLLGENVEMVVDLQRCSFLVDMNLTELEQIFLNMASNAHDAMAEHGGYFSIRCQDHTVESPASGAHRDYVKLTFTDTGCGIPSEVLKNIFDPFFTTKQRDGRGTGLGLHIVQSICQNVGGLIDVESFVGKGTTFNVYLPAYRRPAVPEGSQALPSLTQDVSVVGGTETVLLVEDDAMQREATAQMLQCLGYRVLTAQNGFEVLSYFLNQLEQIDLVICDMVMPVINGIELAKRLLEQKPSLRILFCTGYASQVLDLMTHTPLDPHPHSVLTKPFNMPQLAGKLRSLLAGKQEQRASLPLLERK